MNESNKHTFRQKPSHLFSPHTSHCVFCGIRAEDDLLENTTCERPPCKACDGKGWIFSNIGNDQSPHFEIQRCDACGEYQNDLAALEAVVNAAKSQSELLEFLERLSLLKHEGEPGEDGPCERSSEDSIATLNELIMQARTLLGTTEKCDECGESVPYVIGCPDGSEVCQDCFDAGQH